MKLLVTGFVEEAGGSVASANGILLSGLLERDCMMTFFAKTSFVDPRPAVASSSNSRNLHVIDTTNWFGDGLRRALGSNSIGVFNRALVAIDVATYNRGLVRRMASAKGDLDLWMGDWARGRSTRPVISFLQGPPGTDARSVLRHRDLIVKLAGKRFWRRLSTYARWKLSFGMPDYSFSDHIIVGSNWSKNWLLNNVKMREEFIHVVPYPIDLDLFRPSKPLIHNNDGPLRLLWLGRFVPRKRLDVFLDGLENAVRAGCDVVAHIVGHSGFVPGFERLVREFPFPERLFLSNKIKRLDVPSLLHSCDLLVQPSEEENFGSSVAESLACGRPAIVGPTNGTRDYICDRSIVLNELTPQSISDAIMLCAVAKKRGEYRDPEPSRNAAVKWFDPASVADKLYDILKNAINIGVTRRAR